MGNISVLKEDNLKIKAKNRIILVIKK